MAQRPYTGTGLIQVDGAGNIAIIDPNTLEEIASYPVSGGPWTFKGGARLSGPNPWIDPTAASVTIGGTVFTMGAKGDGVTDDTTAIQNAINAINQSLSLTPASGPRYGGVVQLPAADFLTGQLKLYRGVTLRGLGPNATRLRLKGSSTAAGHIILGTINESQTGIESLTLDGNKGAQGARTVSDAAITSGANALTSATAAFTAADSGTSAYIAGAGASGNELFVPNIQFVNATTVNCFQVDGVTALNAGTTVTNALLWVGTNDAVITDNTGTTGFQDGYPQSRHRMRDVVIKSYNGSGVHPRGQGAAAGNRLGFYYGVQVQDCDIHGWMLDGSSDDFYVNDFSGGSGLEGWAVLGSTQQLATCRAVTSGKKTATRGDGFLLGKGLKQRMLTSCFSQSNQQHGYNLQGNGDTAAACIADSNGANLAGTNAGFFANGCLNCDIGGLAVNNGISGGQQDYGLRHAGGPTNNNIRIKSVNPFSTVDFNGTIGDTNVVMINGERFGADFLTAQTAAVASVMAVTSPNDALKHVYRVSGTVLITTLGSGNINLEVTYTDSGGTARTCIIPLCAEAGTFATSATTADEYKGSVVIMVNPNTAITILTAGTFTGATYNVSGLIERLR